MAKQALNTIKSWFKRGAKPTQQQFSDTFDSFVHKDDLIPQEKIEDFADTINQMQHDVDNAFANSIEEVKVNGVPLEKDGKSVNIDIPENPDPQVPADWNQTDEEEPDFIKNKPVNLVEGSANGSVRGKNTSVEDSNYTMGVNAVSLGSNTKASGQNSFAGGANTNATGEDSFAFGNDIHADGKYSKATGYKQWATSKEKLDANGTLDGNANGFITKDIKVRWEDIRSDAESINGSYQTGEGAEVSGAKHVVFGSRSVASGNNNLITGRDSHACNSNNEVYGNYSHAEGRGNQSWGNAQSVFGKYNDPLKEEGVGDNNPYLEIVGNGTSSSARSNARTLDKFGNEKLSGNLTIGGMVNRTDMSNEDDACIRINVMKVLDISQVGNNVTIDIPDGYVATPYTAESFTSLKWISMCDGYQNLFTGYGTTINISGMELGIGKDGDDQSPTYNEMVYWKRGFSTNASVGMNSYGTFNFASGAVMGGTSIRLEVTNTNIPATWNEEQNNGMGQPKILIFGTIYCYKRQEEPFNVHNA